MSPGGGCARALYGALVAVEGVGAEEQLPPAPRHQGGRHDAGWRSLLLNGDCCMSDVSPLNGDL